MKESYLIGTSRFLFTWFHSWWNFSRYPSPIKFWTSWTWYSNVFIFFIFWFFYFYIFYFLFCFCFSNIFHFFLIFSYTNVQYPFPVDPPRVPADKNSVGCYRRNFQISENWRGQKIFLRFDGVKSAFYVWINGYLVGYSQDSMGASEFDITQYVKIGGDNLIAVQVFRWSDGSYLERQVFIFIFIFNI